MFSLRNLDKITFHIDVDVVAVFWIFLALEPLNVKFCSVVDKICRKSSTAMQINEVYLNAKS